MINTTCYKPLDEKIDIVALGLQALEYDVDDITSLIDALNYFDFMDQRIAHKLANYFIKTYGL